MARGAALPPRRRGPQAPAPPPGAVRRAILRRWRVGRHCRPEGGGHRPPHPRPARCAGLFRAVGAWGGAAAPKAGATGPRTPARRGAPGNIAPLARGAALPPRRREPQAPASPPGAVRRAFPRRWRVGRRCRPKGGGHRPPHPCPARCAGLFRAVGAWGGIAAPKAGATGPHTPARRGAPGFSAPLARGAALPPRRRGPQAPAPPPGAVRRAFPRRWRVGRHCRPEGGGRWRGHTGKASEGAHCAPSLT